MNFGWPNVEIGQKMANGRLLFLALHNNCENMQSQLLYSALPI